MLLPSPIQATTFPSQPPSALPHREQVGQDLAGMEQVGEAVDHRNGAVARQLLHVGVIVGPDHDAVEIAGQHPGGIADRLAPAELDVARRRGRARARRAGTRRPRRRPGCGWSSWRRSSPASCPPAASRRSRPASSAPRGRTGRCSSALREVGDGEEVAWGGHGEPIVVATSGLWKPDAPYSPQPNSSRAWMPQMTPNSLPEEPPVTRPSRTAGPSEKIPFPTIAAVRIPVKVLVHSEQSSAE